MRRRAMREARHEVVTYDAGAGPRVGVLDGERVVDAGFDGDMVAFIAAGAPVTAATPVDGRPPAGAAAPAHAARLPRLRGPPEERATATSAARSRQEWYEVPAYYKGMPDTVIGPGRGDPAGRRYTDELDHELELAAVIGRTVKDVAREDAAGGVFGYTIWNDFSARDVQRRELPVGMGPGKAKDWDGSNVLGPCIVTADEFDAPTRSCACASTASSGARTPAPTCTTPSPT